MRLHRTPRRGESSARAAARSAALYSMFRRSKNRLRKACLVQHSVIGTVIDSQQRAKLKQYFFKVAHG
eukprot:3400637-Prymnesium_polylepis.1